MSSDPTAAPTGADLATAMVSTLAYAEVFDYPLTVAQIHRYLVRVPATISQVEEMLSRDPWLVARVERHGDLVCLRGRSAIIPRVASGPATRRPFGAPATSSPG